MNPNPASTARRPAQVFPFPQAEASFVLGVADAEDRGEISASATRSTPASSASTP